MEIEINPPPERQPRWSKGGHNPTGKRRPDETTMRFQDEVLRLRREGMSFPRIAEHYGMTQGYIYKVYKKALKGIVVENVVELRKLELERLDSLQDEVTRVLRSFTPVLSQGKIVRDFMEDENGNLVLDEFNNPIPIKLQDNDIKMKAVVAALKIMDRRARLLGLDAPVKQEVTGANGGPIQTQSLTVTMTLEQAREEAAKRGLPITIFQT